MVQDIYIGLDNHDNSISSQRAEGKGNPKHRKIKTGTIDMERFRATVEKKRQPDQRVYVAYEAGPHGPQLKKQIEAWGWTCHIIAPHTLDSNQRQRNQKCDSKDALRVLDALRGHYLAGKKLHICWIPDDELRDHREIVRERVDFADEITAVKNRISGFLRQYGIKRPADISDPWTQKHLKWLHSIARNETLMKYASEKLLSLLRRLTFLGEELLRLTVLEEELSDHPRYKKQIQALTKEKGVGILTAMTVLLEMGDPHRFANRKQIGSYFGLVPKQNESGKQDNRKGRITRTGSPRVRKILNQSAWSMKIHGDADVKMWYNQLAARRGTKKATVALMRRLLIRLWHIACETA